MRQIFTIRRLAITVLLAVAVTALVVAAQQTKETNQAVKITDTVVKEVYPANGDLDLRQATIGFQLDPLYTGRLIIDGKDIPDDQVRYVIGLNQYLYRPGPGTETGALAPGHHKAIALIWERDKDETSGRRFPWEFDAH